MARLWVVVGHGLTCGTSSSRPFDHVCHRPRCPAKSNHWDLPALLTHQVDGVKHALSSPSTSGVRLSALKSPGVALSAGNTGPLPFTISTCMPMACGMTRMSEKMIRHRAVGCFQGLQGDLCEFGLLHLEEVGHDSQRHVLGEVPAGLPHDPDGGALGHLALRRAQEQVVLQRGQLRAGQSGEARHLFIMCVRALFCPHTY